MHFIFIDRIITGELATAICRTLLHSLWQGLILAIFAGLTLAFTRHSRSAIRYNILSGLLLVFTVGSICTFACVCRNEISVNPQDVAGSGAVEMGPGVTASLLSVGDKSAEKKGFIEMAVDFFIGHASLITSIWIAILLLKMASIGLSIRYARRIKVTMSYVPSENWRERVRTFGEQLRIGRPVTLLESGIIKMPAVFGYFRPVIFVPLGFLNNLPSDQMEAILIHELGHIKRNDYLVNLLQGIVATLFFFNPAVLWISTLIREERENCCDDIVLEMTNNKRQLVQALINSMMFGKQRNMAVAFAGNGNQVMNRITRIVKMRNKTLHPIEQILLVCGLLVGGAIAFSFSPRSGAKGIPASSTYIDATLKNTKVGSLLQGNPGPRNTTFARSAIYPTVKQAVGLKHTADPMTGKRSGSMTAAVEDTLPFAKLPLADLPIVQPMAGSHVTAPHIPHAGVPRKTNPHKTDSLFSKIGLNKLPVDKINDTIEQKLQGVIADLISEKIIKDKEALRSFSLTEKELFINDVKQRDNLQQQLWNKYMKNSKFGLYYDVGGMEGLGQVVPR